MSRKHLTHKTVCAAIFAAALLLISCGSAVDESPDAETTSLPQETVTAAAETESALPAFSAEESTAPVPETAVTTEAQSTESEAETQAAEETPAPLTEAQEQYALEKDAILAAESGISAVSEIPCIYINTKDHEYPVSKEKYLDCTIDVFNTADDYAMSGTAARVRVRGNATSNGEQPPLRIKFDNKTNLLGLHDGTAFKTWVILKPSWFMIADHLAFQLGRTLLGPDYYVSDSTFVHLYVNGEDWGIRLACEQNQINNNRVNVKEAESETTDPTDMGYFFELDNYYKTDDSPAFWVKTSETPVTDINGVTHTSADEGFTVKNDEISNGQLQYLSDYVNNVWTIIWNATYKNTAWVIDADGKLQESSDLTPEEAVEQVLDIDSAVNTYILEEIYHDYDRGIGSFFMAVDFSEGAEYDRLTFLAPWDFAYNDWTDDGTGIHTGVFTTSGDINDTDNYWLIMLYRNDWFRRLVAERFAALTASDALKDVTAAVDEELQTLYTDAAVTNQTAAVDSGRYFITYTNKRIDWLADYFSKLN